MGTVGRKWLKVEGRASKIHLSSQKVRGIKWLPFCVKVKNADLAVIFWYEGWGSGGQQWIKINGRASIAYFLSQKVRGIKWRPFCIKSKKCNFGGYFRLATKNGFSGICFFLLWQLTTVRIWHRHSGHFWGRWFTRNKEVEKFCQPKNSRLRLLFLV